MHCPRDKDLERGNGELKQHDLELFVHRVAGDRLHRLADRQFQFGHFGRNGDSRCGQRCATEPNAAIFSADHHDFLGILDLRSAD